MIDLIEPAIRTFTDFLLRYFVALVAVGALAMALIELWKKMRHSETRFHAKHLTAWFAADTPPSPRVDAAVTQGAYAELIHLTTSVPMASASTTAVSLLAEQGIKAGPLWVAHQADYALFALSLERMMGHVQDAADSALNNPRRYPALYIFVTAGADEADVAAWRELAESRRPGRDEPEEARRRAELYARLHQIVKRRLDGFQLYTKQRWVNWNQLTANIVGALVLFAGLLWSSVDMKYPPSLAAMIAMSLLGGVLAPVAKDMVAALQKVRQGG
jgi:hypothetical protein